MRWLAFVAILLSSCSDSGSEVVLPDARPWVHDLQRSEPDRCLTADDCTIYGYCATVPNTDDECWAMDGPHCGASMACHYHGLCTFRVVDGLNVCVAATDADCSRSSDCKFGSKCHACKHVCQVAYCD